MHTRRFLAGFLLLGVFVVGCVNRYEFVRPVQTVQHPVALAVIPFQGSPEVPASGQIVADIMVNQLYATGQFAIVSPELVASRLASHEGEALSPAELGRVAQAPFILTGRVIEYTYKAGLGETPAVAIAARLTDAATGMVLWSANSGSAGAADSLKEESLSGVSTRICQQMAVSLAQFFSENPSLARQKFALRR